MTDTLRPWIARVAAVLVSGVAGWLFVKFGIDVPADVRQLLTDTVMAVMVMLATYVATHIPISKTVNPEDAASTGAAKEGKAKQRQRKHTRAVEDRIRKAGVEVPAPLAPNSPELPPETPIRWKHDTDEGVL